MADAPVSAAPADAIADATQVRVASESRPSPSTDGSPCLGSADSGRVRFSCTCWPGAPSPRTPPPLFPFPLARSLPPSLPYSLFPISLSLLPSPARSLAISHDISLSISLAIFLALPFSRNGPADSPPPPPPPPELTPLPYPFHLQPTSSEYSQGFDSLAAL